LLQFSLETFNSGFLILDDALAVIGQLPIPDRCMKFPWGNAVLGVARRKQQTVLELPALPAIPRRVAGNDVQQLGGGWWWIVAGFPAGNGANGDAEGFGGLLVIQTDFKQPVAKGRQIGIGSRRSGTGLKPWRAWPRARFTLC